MLDIKKAAKDGLEIYKEKIRELIKWVLPILVAQDLLTRYYVELTSDFSPSWFFSTIELVASQTLSAAAIFIGISICLSDAAVKFDWSKVIGGRLFVMWFATVYLTLAVTLGMAFFIIPGILILVVSFFYAIYIVEFNQGPIEALTSSIDVAKESWLRLTIMVAIMSAIWVGITWGIESLIIPLVDFIPLSGVVVWGFLSVLYMYNYAITVSSWNQLKNAT